MSGVFQPLSLVTQDTQYIETTQIPGAPVGGSVSENVRFLTNVGIANPATNSIADFIKNHMHHGTLNDEGGYPNPTTSATLGAFGSYVQIVASCAHTVIGMAIVLQSGSTASIRASLGTGAGGSEVNKVQVRFQNNTAVGTGCGLYIPIAFGLIPKGTRVALAAANDSAASAVGQNFGVTLYESND